jgi:hypothetical protein
MGAGQPINKYYFINSITSFKSAEDNNFSLNEVVLILLAVPMTASGCNKSNKRVIKFALG